MISGMLPPVDRRSTWTIQIGYRDTDTEGDIDPSLYNITIRVVPIYTEHHGFGSRPVLEAKTIDGTITFPGPTTAEARFEPDQMFDLCGLCQVDVTITYDGVTDNRSYSVQIG